ncbi:MAG: N-acetylmuramoyl-L-alanine amidase [Actinomycetota bacterium]
MAPPSHLQVVRPRRARAQRRRRAVRRLRTGVIVAAGGLFLSFLPLPLVAFEMRSAGAVSEVPELHAASGSELAEIESETGERPGESSVIGGDESVEPFTTIGFRMSEPLADPVYVRLIQSDGSYGEWDQLDLTDEGPDEGTAEAAGASVTTDPLFVGSATGYEVSLPSGADAEVVTVHDRMQRVSVESTSFASTKPPPFSIKRTTDWGARPVTGVATAQKLTLGVIHHTAGSNNYTAAQVPSILRGIQAYHIDGRGWTDAGYNFAVDKFGTVWEMRATSVDANAIGAHAIAFNTGSVGVAILGDYISSTAPDVAIEGAAQVFGWKLASNGVDPTGRTAFTAGSGSDLFSAGTVADLSTIVGHRETSSTSCPGRIMEQLGSMRARAGFWASQSLGGASPTGAIDSIKISGVNVVVTGWLRDEDTWDTISGVFVNRDRRVTIPSNGGSYRFVVSDVAFPGTNEVCIIGINVFGGRNQPVDCKTIVK